MKKKLTPLRLPALCLAALLALSGCGATATSETTSQADSAAVSSSAATQSTVATPEQTGETRTISTVMGDVEIPANPQRVACYTWAGDLVSLGITPVISNDADLASMSEVLAGTQKSLFENPEEIMAADPDLIIIRDKDDYETYSKIAPTLVVEYDTPLEERMAFFGEVFGLEDKAQELLDAFHAKVERYVQDFKDKGLYGKTVVIAFPNENSVWVYGDDFGFGGQLLYPTLGFQVTDLVQEKLIDTKEQRGEISWELVNDYLDADFIEIYLPDAALQTMLDNNDVWQAVPAVKNGNIITYDSQYDRKSLYVMDKALDSYHDQFMALADRETNE